MRTRTWRIVRAVVAVGLLVLVGRLAWVLCRSETGWGTVVRPWRDAALAPVVGEYLPLASREPDEQAEFWLAEVDRLVAADPENAEVALAAAWFLDMPAGDYQSRHFKSAPFFPEVAASLDLPPLLPDQEFIDAAEEGYEAKCRAKCLAMAARATELAPGDRRTWQSRALLLGNTFSHTGKRLDDPAWLQALDECMRHDPDNALYDYLAAQSLWEGVLDCDFPGGEPKWRITDPRRGVEAQERFDRGQEKRLTVDEGVSPVLDRFLRRSAVPRPDRETAFHAICLQPRVSLLVLHLARTQWRLAEVRQDAGDFPAAFRHLQQANRLLEEFISAPGNLAGSSSVYEIRAGSLRLMRSLVEAHPSLVGPDELAKIKERERAAVAAKEALCRTASVVNPRLWPLDPVGVTAYFVSDAVLPGIVVLLVAALIAGAIALALGPRQPGRRPMGLVGHALAWVIGCGAGIAAFGLAPAGLIPSAVQAWALAGLIAITCIVVAIVVADALAGLTLGMRMPYAARVVCGLLLGLAASYVVLSLLGVRWDGIGESRLASIQMPVRGRMGIDPQVLEYAVKRSVGDRYWAVVQWLAHRGPYFCAIIPLVLVAVWQWLRSGGWKDEAGEIDFGSRGKRWRTTVDSVRRSAVTAALCLLVFYVAVAPTYVHLVENRFQAAMAFYRDPQAWGERVHSTMAAIQAEPQQVIP